MLQNITDITEYTVSQPVTIVPAWPRP